MFRTQEELNFWRQLCSPFPVNSYKQRPGHGGKTYSYISRRTLENRLDEVVGPTNWDTEYEIGQRGVTCKLKIRYKVYSDNGELAGFDEAIRSGGGGFRDNMETPDAADKSAYTSAFRVACSSFGIGRDLYEEGMPSYVADLFGGWASGLPQDRQTAPAPQQPPAGGYSQQSSGQQGPRFDPPIGKIGKAAYAWAKSMTDYFQFDLLAIMVNLAKSRNLSVFTDRWDEAFTNEALAAAVVAASRQPTYKGELDQWLPQQTQQVHQQQSLPMQATPVNPGSYGQQQSGSQSVAAQVQQNIVNNPTGLEGVKKAIVAQITALVFTRTGHAPSKEEQVAAICEISAAVNDGNGVRGQILRSLRDCNDAKWLGNMKSWADKAIADLSKDKTMQQAEDDGLPC